VSHADAPTAVAGRDRPRPCIRAQVLAAADLITGQRRCGAGRPQFADRTDKQPLESAPHDRHGVYVGATPDQPGPVVPMPRRIRGGTAYGDQALADAYRVIFFAI